jgi:hypothetical protein
MVPPRCMTFPKPSTNHTNSTPNNTQLPIRRRQ